MRRSGSNGASLGRCLELSGAPKGSLYHYFPEGKSVLIEAALQRFAEQFSVFLIEIWTKPQPFHERWTLLLNAMERGLRKSAWSQGCPAAAVVLDLEGTGPGDEAEPGESKIRAAAQHALHRWAEHLESGLPEIHPSARAAFAQSLLALIEGALILARADRTGRPFQSARTFGIAAHRSTAHT